MSLADKLVKHITQGMDDYIITSLIDERIREFFDKEKEQRQREYGNDCFPCGRFIGMSVDYVVANDYRYCVWAEKTKIGSEAFQECLSNALFAQRKARALAKKSAKK